MVVAYHLWPTRFPGGLFGVDAFFVISGFLITAHLAADFDRGARAPFGFWARRIRRLIPASLVSLFVTSVAVVMVVPERLWRQFLGDVLWSAAYGQNWHLAHDSVNYLAAQAQPSPVEHFWTLSLEEQFYIAWPLLLFIGVVLVARRPTHDRRRRALVGVATIVLVASFIFAVAGINHASPAPFFWTTARAWEFAVGALLALWSSRRAALPPGVAILGSWIGWGMLGGTTLLLGATSHHPGFATLLPVMGTAVVIACGSPQGHWGPAPLVGLPPVQYLGAVSYSLYLWHWPIIILAPFVLGSDLGFTGKLVALALALVLAAISYRWVETPVRSGRPRWTRSTRGAMLGLVVATAAVAVVPIAGLTMVAQHERAAQQVMDSLQTAPPPEIEPRRYACLGAAAAVWPETCTPIDIPPLVPSTMSAPTDNGRVGSIPVCHVEDWYDAAFAPCEYVGGNGTGARVMVLGDSHTRPLLALVSALADRFDWRVAFASKGHCPYSAAQVNLGDRAAEDACAEWFAQARLELEQGDIDLLITSQKRGEEWLPFEGSDGEDAAVAGLDAAWRAAVASGVRVLAIEDNPSSREDVQDCLDAHFPGSLEECGMPPDEALDFDPQVEAAMGFSVSQVQLVSFTDVYCNAGVCLPVIGSVNVYRDGDHVTATWAATLVPVLLDRVDEAFLTTRSSPTP